MRKSGTCVRKGKEDTTKQREELVWATAAPTELGELKGIQFVQLSCCEGLYVR